MKEWRRKEFFVKIVFFKLFVKLLEIPFQLLSSYLKSRLTVKKDRIDERRICTRALPQTTSN